MIHECEKYQFVRNPRGSSEMNVIFINTNCIRSFIIETRVERTAEAQKEEGPVVSFGSDCMAPESYCQAMVF